MQSHRPDAPPALTMQVAEVEGSTPRLILPVLVFAQFLALSLWFSGSSVVPALREAWGLRPQESGMLLSFVNAGFICGTLLMALSNLADRFSASRVFLSSTVIGAAANIAFARSGGLEVGLFWRFITGLALAGIYPVGMKLVVSWFPTKAGSALGWLVGALTLGSASPYLVAAAGPAVPWRGLLSIVSVMAIVAGVLVAWVGNGPHIPPARRIALGMLFKVFKVPGYRGAALGYFGHMWELYAVWALFPLLAGAAWEALGAATPARLSLSAFLLIGVGGVGCVIGGMISRRWGSIPVAAVSLAVSGLLCLVTPWIFAVSPLLYLASLMVWGFFVVADSPQFSALSSRNCPAEYVATALTVQNGLGFALTIVSIEMVTRYFPLWGPSVSWLLLPGPILGVFAFLAPGHRTLMRDR